MTDLVGAAASDHLVAQRVLALVSEEYGVTVEQILAQDRRAHINEARRAAAGAMKAAGLTAAAAGRALERDHSSILTHLKLIAADEGLRLQVESLGLRARAGALPDGEDEATRLGAADLYARLLPILPRPRRLAVMAYVLRELLCLPWRGFGPSLVGARMAPPSTVLGYYTLATDAAALEAAACFLADFGRGHLAELLRRRVRRSA